MRSNHAVPFKSGASTDSAMPPKGSQRLAEACFTVTFGKIGVFTGNARRAQSAKTADLAASSVALQYLSDMSMVLWPRASINVRGCVTAPIQVPNE
jgi:hypothetical protein